ncbi:MAG: SCO family protein [Limisphaerales bacterium]
MHATHATRQALILPLIACLLTACKPDLTRLSQHKQVGDFSLVDQNGQPFERHQLTKKIWIANFFFAGCTTECSSVLHNIATLQSELKSHPDVLLVSFTTDPRSDTPDVLKAFSEPFQPETNRWFFLTGDRQQILRTIVGDFLMPITTDFRAQADLLSGLVHSDQLALVDKTGTIRAYFNGLDPEMPDQVLEAMKQLQEESSR